MKVEYINQGERGSFRAVEEGREAGIMTFTWAGPDKFIIDHTEVWPDFAGKGVGKLLVMEAVKVARENHLFILPLCPFAKKMFDRTEEIRDVLFHSINKD